MPRLSAGDQLLDRLVWMAKHGIAPNALALLPQQVLLVDKVIAAFGSLALARQRMAGDWRRESDFETPAAVTSALKRLHAAAQRLTPRRLRELGEEQLVKAVYAHFGSFARARVAAGLPAREKRLPRPETTPIMSKDESLDEYRRWIELNPRTRRRDLPRALTHALEHHVGGITAARQLLSVPPRRWNRERVIAMLADELRAGRSVTSESFEAEGRTDIVNAIYRHVGSMVDARALAEAVVGSHAVAARRLKAPRVRRSAQPRAIKLMVTAKEDRALPGVAPTVTRKQWSEFVSRCRAAARRDTSPPHDLSIMVPAALLSGLHAEVAAAGVVLVDLLENRADFLEITAPRADHLVFAGIVNALECAGVKVPPSMVRRCRGWITVLKASPATAKAASLARLVEAHRMSVRAAGSASAQALLREREVTVEHFAGTIVSRRHRAGDANDWLNLVRSTPDERRRELDPLELLWAARIRYHHLEGASVGTVAARLGRDLAG